MLYAKYWYFVIKERNTVDYFVIFFFFLNMVKAYAHLMNAS